MGPSLRRYRFTYQVSRQVSSLINQRFVNASDSSKPYEIDLGCHSNLIDKAKAKIWISTRKRLIERKKEITISWGEDLTLIEPPAIENTSISRCGHIIGPDFSDHAIIIFDKKSPLSQLWQLLTLNEKTKVIIIGSSNSWVSRPEISINLVRLPKERGVRSNERKNADGEGWPH